MSVSALFRRLKDRSGRNRPPRRPRRDRFAPEALEDRAVPATLSNFLTVEHVDLNAGFSGGNWSLSPRDADNEVSHAPDDALLYVGAPALTTRTASTAFDFIGVGAGEEYYRLPQSQNPNLLYLGFAGYGVASGSLDRYNPSAESKGRVSGLGRWLKVGLVDVKHFAPDGTPGAGKFSVWQSEDTGPKVFMSNANDGIANPGPGGLDATDGIGPDDALWVIAGGHIHYNWGFTEKGRYEVTFKLSGYQDDGNTTSLGAYTEGEPITLYFSVGGVGQFQFDASSYSVDEAAGTASVTVRRINGSDGRISVQYAALAGSATAGLDFNGVSGTLTFNDRETEKTIAVPIINDALVEGDETASLVLSNPGPATIAGYVADPSGDDSSLLGANAMATLTIIDDDAATNTPPTISDIADQSTDEGVPKEVAFTVGDAETPAGSLIVTATSSNTALVPNANLVPGGAGASRTLAIAPLAGLSGTTTITVKVKDADGVETMDTFILTVNATNSAPVANPQSIAVDEDVPKAIILTGSDADGDPLTYIIVSGPNHGTLSGTAPNLTYTPNPDYAGPDEFTFRVSDGTADSPIAKVSISVGNQNDAPTISPIADQQIDEDASAGPLAFTVGDAETPAGALVVTATSSSPGLIPAGNIALGGSGANRTVSVIPAANQFGTADITLTVTDADGGTASVTFRVVVNPVNDAPIISPIEDVVMNEDGDVTITFTVGDAEADPASLVVTRARTNNNLFALGSTYQLGGSGATRTLRLRPTADRSGTSDFTISVSDGSRTASRTFRVTVDPAWDAPRLLPDNLLAIPDTTSTLDVLANDRAIEPGQALTIQSSSQPAHGTLALGPGGQALRYTPAPGYLGPDEFTYTVVDNTGLASTSTGYITVAPYMVVDSPTNPQHTDLSYNSVDGQWILNIKTDARFAGGAQGGANNPTLLDADEGLLLVDAGSKMPRPANNSFGNFDFIGVPAGSDIWLLRESSFQDQVFLGWSTEGTPSGTFAEFAANDPRVPGWSEEWMVIELVGFSGPGQFSAFDSGIGDGPRVWFDTADGINSPADADSGGNPTDAFWAWQGTHAHMAWAFTAPGRYDLRFRAVGWKNDGQGGLSRVESPVTTYHFDVDAESAPGQRLGEAPPIARDDRATAQKNGGAVPIDVLVNDRSSPDPREVLAVASVSQGAGGAVSIAEGGLGVVYLPRPGFFGKDSFTYTVIDEHGGLATATVAVDVQGSNAAPVATDNAYLVGAGNSVRGNVLFNDGDPDGDPLSLGIVDGPTKGTLALNPDGSFTYTPDTSFDGEDAFTYSIADAGGLSATARVAIAAAGPRDFLAVLTEGHADVGIAYEDGEWNLHIHDEAHDEEYAPGQALLFVGPEAETARDGALAAPAFDFLGVAPGQTFYRLPESLNPDLLFLGIGAEELAEGTFAGGKVRLRLKAVDGPGSFSAWRSEDEGPRLLMASADGVTGGDFIDALEASHTHVNWGFGARGRYEITFEAVATLPSGEVTSSGDVTYVFSVDNRGKVSFDADSYGVDEGGNVSVTVRREGGADGPLTVGYSAAGGTAGPDDFDPFGGEITFADGETAKTITFASRQDPGAEGDESVVISLIAPEGAGAILGSPAEATVTIRDDDAPLQVEQVTINDGAAQRSSIEAIAVRFSRETNLQSLIDGGGIVDAVKVASGSAMIPLTPAHFRYDAATLTLRIDLTADGFGGGRTSLLADGRYELVLDTAAIRTTGSSPANRLADGDGTADGAYRSAFHRLLGDFDGDAEVKQPDVDLFLAHYGGISGRNWLYDAIFDLAGAGGRPDGAINTQDFLELRRRFGRKI